MSRDIKSYAVIDDELFTEGRKIRLKT